MDLIAQIYEKREAEQLARNRDYRPPRTPTIRASEVASCPRQIYHRLVGDHPRPGDVSGADYGLGGDAAHDVVRRLMNEYGVKVLDVVDDADGMQEMRSGRREFDVDGTTVAFTARTDGAVMLPDGRKALLEIKSISSYAHRQMTQAFVRGGDKALRAHIEKTALKYIWQCHVGMRVHDFDVAYLVIYNRETCTTGLLNERTGARVGGIIIERDDEAWAEILATGARITKAVLAKTALRPGRMDGSKDCGWCAFYEHCHGAIKAKAKEIANEPQQ